MEKFVGLLTLYVICSLSISLILFFILRALVLWYWKINERLSQAQRTNVLLEKLLIQMGATDVDEITLKDIETGEIKKITIDEWIRYKEIKASEHYEVLRSTPLKDNEKEWEFE